MAKKILIAGKERNLSHFVSMELQKKTILLIMHRQGKRLCPWHMKRILT